MFSTIKDPSKTLSLGYFSQPGSKMTGDVVEGDLRESRVKFDLHQIQEEKKKLNLVWKKNDNFSKLEQQQSILKKKNQKYSKYPSFGSQIVETVKFAF